MNDTTGPVNPGIFCRLEDVECIARRLVSKICTPEPEAGVEKLPSQSPLEALGNRLSYVNFLLGKVEDELNKL